MIRLHRVHMPPRDELMPALERMLYSGHVTQGPKVAEFERAFGSWLGTPNVVTVNSGTSALQLALRLAGVRGGEVISTPMTCVATNMPILAEGARVVWADVDPATGNIDPADVARKITGDTCAIMAVHWGGRPCDLRTLSVIAWEHGGIPVIEDAAHALGAEWDGRKVGHFTADFSCFSLQAIKHITTIDGGVLAIRRPRSVVERARRLRWYGIDRDQEDRIGQDIPEYGHKWHMNDVTATIGLAQLPYLDQIVAAHRDNAAYYDRALDGRLGTKRAEGKGRGAWWLYTVLLRDEAERAEFAAWMAERGVEVSRVHARNDMYTCFRESRTDLPGVDEFSSRMCCVPVHSGLSEDDRQRVASAMVSFCESRTEEPYARSLPRPVPEPLATAIRTARWEPL